MVTGGIGGSDFKVECQLNICTIAHYSQVAGAIFGLIAAAVWLLASLVKAPPELTQNDMIASNGDIIPVLDRLMRAVATQSELNAQAALLTAIAAALSLWQAFMPTCWG